MRTRWRELRPHRIFIARTVGRGIREREGMCAVWWQSRGAGGAAPRVIPSAHWTPRQNRMSGAAHARDQSCRRARVQELRRPTKPQQMPARQYCSRHLKSRSLRLAASPLRLAWLSFAILAIALFFWWGKSQTKTVEPWQSHRIGPRRSRSRGLVPVEYAAWSDQVPDDAEILSCREEVRGVVDQPAPNSA